MLNAGDALPRGRRPIPETARAAAARADRTAVLDAVAHDVRHPLTLAKGQAQYLERLLERRAVEPDQLAVGLESIAAAVDRAAELLDELLDVARLESGEVLTLHPEPVDLVALTDAAVTAAQRSTDRHVLRLDVATLGLSGRWDARRLRRVLDNLLGNAIAYSPDGDDIAVHVRREAMETGAQAVLAVCDQGIGIPANDLPHVFECFHRGGNVDAIPGTGLGLAAVKRIVALHGGTVAIASAEGRGTTVTIRLPLEARQDRPSAVPQDGSGEGGPADARERPGGPRPCPDRAAMQRSHTCSISAAPAERTSRP
ncbi:MAG TPA: HAMP domain-containing sensor histidine kinase [Thermomicrobiales bacterium]|nr:HAMP domain-containing sensor histidine kinase [Thermomicrobiales bacterium]